MEIWVNGARVEPPGLEDLSTLEELVQRVSERFAPQGETVTEILLDEHAIHPGEEGTLSIDHTVRSGRLEIKTRNPAELALDTLREGAIYLDHLVPGLNRTASLFREHRVEEASTLLADAVEGMHWFAKMVEHTQGFAPMDYSRETLDGVGVLEHYRSLEPMVSHLLEAQQKQGWKEMADVLETDLVPYFDRWRRILEELLSRCASEAGS